MVITVPPPLASALAAQAGQRGVAPEEFALDVLRQHLTPPPLDVAADEWERRLFGAAVACGVSVPDEALSSDGLYE